MKEILKEAQTYQFTSLKYVDIDSIQLDIDEDIIIATKDYIIICNKNQDDYNIYWAAKTYEALYDAFQEFSLNINDLLAKQPNRLYIEFVDPQIISLLEDIGFVIVSQFIDFWNRNMSTCNYSKEEGNGIVLRAAKEKDYFDISLVTKMCKDQSRGFYGEEVEFIKDWNEELNSCILLAEMKGQIVGGCLISVYGFDSDKGPVIWIRQLAVNPMYQNQGVGSLLLEQSLHWGKNKGAKRSFLAVDKQNIKAINLYTKYGFSCNDEIGQINMAFYNNK